LPTGSRERRLLIVLQAFIDDSGSEPGSPVFVLAGYIAPTSAWATFANDWDAELSGGGEFPKLEYFKMAEAMGLRDQFALHRGWTPELRDKLLVRLTAIIKRTSQWQVCASMGQRDFAETLQRLPAFGDGRTLANDHPYAFLWYQLISELWLRADEMKTAACDFIFDQQMGFEEEVLRYWKMMKAIVDRNAPQEWASWLTNAPIFRDEFGFKPLQAADLHAWTIRRLLSGGSASLRKLPIEAVENLAGLKSVSITVPRSYLDAQYKYRMAQVEAILKADPTKVAHYFDPEKTKRQRRKDRSKVMKTDGKNDKDKERDEP
jgi:hypothetical protein